MAECFENAESTQQGTYCISESMWKNEEDSVVFSTFFSSINWNLVTCNEHKFEGGDAKRDCKTREDMLASCADDSFVNYACFIECDQKFNCPQACANKIISRN